MQEEGIVDGCGEAITTLDVHDPVTINLHGLTVNTSHSITITDPDSVDISTLTDYAAGSLSATSDKDGNIFMSTIVQNMPDSAILGDYTVTVSDSARTVLQTHTYTVVDRNRVQCVDGIDPATASAKTSFTSAENVYAAVKGTLADGSYNTYIISDSQKAIPDGALISGTAISVTLTGGSAGIDLGTFASGSYDVLVDVNANGLYNRDIDLISRHARLHPCFSIQATNTGNTLIQHIAADRNGNKREIFDPDADKDEIRDIYANVTPTEASAVSAPSTVDVYVVDHQPVWTQGDPLIDRSGSTPPETNNTPVQSGSNTQGNMLQWSFSHLNPGCYDIVVDTDKDGAYTAGTDYVDNINHLGDTSDCGVHVSNSDSTNVTITSHADNEVTTATAIELAGSINVPVGSLDAAYIRITSGTQTNIISMDTVVASRGGGYNVQIPLFSGDNHITVSGVYSNDTSISETITVRSVTDLALLRAQLTWDGSTDMDLHLVRPGGVYSNGGGGSDDCNFANCSVGLEGTGSNSIDWGELNVEDDDPKLDVDCVSCGNGIENIWMNQINDNGIYKVYVDAFGGNESDSDVIVTISILGSTVDQVNCGNMAAGTATDSCYVGDITWSGGSFGAGSFRAVGTKAADF